MATRHETEHGLLMDLDGTIADTLPHLFRAFRHAVQPYLDYVPSDAEIVATFGPPERECIAKLFKNQPVDRQVLDAAAERFHNYYEGRHAEVQAFPGIPEVIREACERGWKFAVFTGKGTRSAMFTLERLEIWPYVDCLVSGDDVRHPKPDSEGVLQAMQKLQVMPEHVLVVGDSPADILAGKAAGAKTVAALWGAFDVEATKQAGPDWSCRQVVELRPIIAAQKPGFSEKPGF